MKTKALTAAQINMLAQRFSNTPIEPATSAKKAGDTFARLLTARIGSDRAALAFTSIMTADTFDQAEARLTLVLDYGNPDPAGEPIPAPVDEPKAAPATVVGKRQAILDQAKTGALPDAPDFSKPTHARFRAKLAQFVALAEASDIAGLQAFKINPVSSSPKASAKLAQFVALAEASDIAGLQAFKINPVSSSPKAMARYRDLCVIAITARSAVTI